MEYHDSDEAKQLAAEARVFMDDVVIPTEREYLGDGPVPEDVIADLRDEARERGIYCPQIHEEHGGGGYDFADVLPLFEEAGRSLLGATAMRVDAPDEGNMHTIELVGTESQKEEFLEPLVAGELRSGFSMTEPRDGAGSDPKMMRTRAEKDGDEWVINANKYWITNAPYADFAMVFARTSGEDGDYDGVTCFLVDADNPNYEVARIHRTMGMTPGGHGELNLSDCRVPEDRVMGEVGGGFQAAMNWIGGGRINIAASAVGNAQYLLDLAVDYAKDRETFGKPISRRQGISFQLADLATDIEQVRHLYRYAAWKIKNDERARKEESMAKWKGAQLNNKAADIAMQVFGGAGFMKDQPIERQYRSARVLRIFEGTDEIQQRTIARELF